MADICYEWQELRPKLGDLICHIDGKVASLEALEKKIQEKKDESYLSGLEDMKNAISTLTRSIDTGGMSIQDLDEVFRMPSCNLIIEKYTAKEIIDKVNEWKADKNKQKDQLRVGDEVMIAVHNLPSYGETRIVTRIDRTRHSTQLIFVFNRNDGLTTWFSPDCLQKTGKHYDYILLPKEENNE
jgi:hypothetical protein